MADPNTRNAPAPPQKKGRSKACIYCHKSHLVCEDERPCQRCKVRQIAHLCRDVEEIEGDLILPTFVDGYYDLHPELKRPDGPGISGNGAGAGAEGTLTSTTAKGANADKGSHVEDILDGLFDFKPSGETGGLTSVRVGDFGDGLFGIARLNDTASRPTSPQGPTSVQKLSEVEMSMAFGFEFDKPGPADLRDSLRARLKPDELHLLMNLVEPVRNLYLDKWMGLTSDQLMTVIDAYRRRILTFRRTLAMCDFPTLILRPSGRISIITDSLAEMVGYTREHVVGRLNIFDLLGDDSVLYFIQQVAIKMNIPDVKAVVDTVSLRRRDGTHFRARISASKVVDNTPIPICLVIIVLPETNPHPDIVQPNVEIEPRNKEQTASSG